MLFSHKERSLKHFVPGSILTAFVSLLFACSAPVVKNGAEIPTGIERTVTPAIDIKAEFTGVQKYEQEETYLVQILGYYEKALAAHRDGDFDGAETLIDSAFVVYGKVEVGSILDPILASKFTSTSNSLVREFGMILMESDQISKDVSESLVPALTDAELFKAGQWTDEELKNIVAQISKKCDIPIDFNARVRGYIYYFQTRGRRTMTTWLQRSGRYLPMIRDIFAEENIPLDLAYLCFNESGLNPKAVSPVGAAGLWQFMPATGADYGLKRTAWVDERRDPEKATHAAAKHLKRVSGLYDDWNLVIAAYDWGEGRVNRSVQSGIVDYWKMNAPVETQNYVPINMALIAIAKAPEIFGFEGIVPDSELEYDTVEVRSGMRLKDAAKCADVNVEEMRLLNSELVRDCTPADSDSYQLRIPKGKADIFLAEYEKLPPANFALASSTDTRGSTTHKVRKGDTLASVSRKYGVTVTALMRANHLKKSSRLKMGRSLTIPGASGVEETVTASDSRDDQPVSNKSSASSVAGKKSASKKSAKKSITYVVKRHDSLSEIAARYGVSHKDLMAWNNIDSPRKIAVGTRLVIKTNR